ncbi:MAG: ABC transporter ATP-binding protein [Lachnospiraceae bacterium]|nr:ABC transporter ATP-binding protein [Lachnospiraceae bacterium]MDE6625281.1 ABC transporter ATP-binding protein [Lachnospiraceae bacterium]
MLEVKNIYKGYNREKVLKDVSLSVMPGEIHGLIGENSAGKTTLIKCITGVYKADKGSVTYDGDEIYDNPSVKEKVGYVADYNDYIKYYTVSRMVYMYENFYPKFSKEKFNEWNRIFKLPVDKRILSLSKGQKMRLAFMLETAKQPDYLILDEPTSGLDPVAKARFYELLINEVEQQEIGVLISSHNLDGLERICDSVTMLEHGIVARQMSMEEMKSELTKLNVVFEGGAGKAVYEIPEILRISNVGSIYSMVVKEYSEDFVKKLYKQGASLVEPVDISLEELFVVLEESKDSKVKESEQSDGNDPEEVRKDSVK